MLLRTGPSPRLVVVSDLHIGDGSLAESFARKDELLRAFLDEVAGRADGLVIAGDGFDLAQAWSLERIYRGHRRLLDDLIDFSRSLPIYYLQGNHDGTRADLEALLPFAYADALEVGAGVHIEHGNALDEHNLPGDRGAFWGARVHAHIERLIRAPVRIPMRKHYLWSTRLGHWLFYRYGLALRERSRRLEAQGQEELARRARQFLDYWGGGEWGDIHGLLEPARQLLERSGLELLILGHAHQAGKLSLAGGTYVNSGSWTYGDSTYVTLDAEHVEVRDFRTGRVIADEEYRGVLGPNAGKSFFDWWERYYRGGLRYDVEAMWRDAGGG